MVNLCSHMALDEQIQAALKGTATIRKLKVENDCGVPACLNNPYCQIFVNINEAYIPAVFSLH